jgi:hypothetical protein
MIPDEIARSTRARYDARWGHSVALDLIERHLDMDGRDHAGRGPVVVLTDSHECRVVGPDEPGASVYRAREYLRRHERARRERVRRIVLSLLPLAAFALMFWRV